LEENLGLEEGFLMRPRHQLEVVEEVVAGEEEKEVLLTKGEARLVRSRDHITPAV